MTIPTSSLYPDNYDSDENLFLVRDSLRLRLLEDYNPGDTTITVDSSTKDFPDSGVVTLTEQCSEIDYRALSFFYGSKTDTKFNDLEILTEFIALDSVKPKKATNVTMNVIAMHHNHLKDSLIAIQSFFGTKYTIDKDTITGRVRYLENLAYRPKAWFSLTPQIGLVPITVTFKNESLRLGSSWIRQTWDFGEDAPVVIEAANLEEYNNYTDIIGSVTINGTTITKVYSNIGIYTVSLLLENEWGSNIVEFENVITAKLEAPEKASISMIPTDDQTYTPGAILIDIGPKIRSLANEFVQLTIESGEDIDRSGYSYAGEPLDILLDPIDPIIYYTWSLEDDLIHANSNSTKASYSLGGLYDIVLRVDTSFGAYRITKWTDSIDIIESTNLWLFNFNSYNANGSGVVKTYEFGLNSETFKLLGNQNLTVDRNSNFLDIYDDPDYNENTTDRAKSEFLKNTFFTPAGTITSGNNGNGILFWAKGGASSDSGEIGAAKYNGFDDTYDILDVIIGRPWNWTSFSSLTKSYFLFGGEVSGVPNSNPSSPLRTDYELSTTTASSLITLTNSDFENGSDELLEHPSEFNIDGLATNGYFATYRSTWKDSVGYILRNSAVNDFFRISSFYKTNGNILNPFLTITRLQNMTGSAKTEGEFVALSNGIFFFNNSGEVSAWNDSTLTWEIGQAGSSSLTFRSVQDDTVSGFDSKANTLLAASDKGSIAYLSYDYSDKAFIKFNGTDLTFTTTRYRPPGKQFQMGVY